MAPQRTEELQEKRGRGQVACAECRRLKVRCDKKIPCGSCVKRGCAAICPTRALSGGQGTRYVLTDTEHLHQKIAEMSHRIRQLEDGLAVLQSTVTNEMHPLLCDDFLSIKFEGEAVRFPPEPADGASIAEAMGILTMSDSGTPNYFGPLAGSETLLIKLDSESTNPDLTPFDISVLPQDLLDLGDKFPFSWDQDPLSDRMEQLENCLPPYPRAWSLFETYVEHFTWYFRPLKREDVIEDLLKPFYKNKTDNALRRPHNIAVLYFLFANAALCDLTLPPYNEEAENYYRLGRAALSLQCIFSQTEMQTVEAISLMGAYHSMSGPRHCLGGAWNITSLACKLGQHIGLHKDGTHWNLSPSIVQRRRNLFWEISVLDLIGSLALGRPPAILCSHIDCEFPLDEGAMPESENEEAKRGYWNWRFWYTRKLYWPLADSASSAKGLTYDEILSIDKDIRQMNLPAGQDKLPEPGDSMQYLQYYMAHQYHPIAMLYLHRKHFAESLIKFPYNPLCSQYAHSTLAAYRYASAIIKSAVENYERFPKLYNRFWTFWTQVFAGAIIVGSIATRSPASSMAQNAFRELCSALELFEKGAAESPRAEAAMLVVRKLKERSIISLLQIRAGIATPINHSDTTRAEDELATFAGHSFLLSHRSQSTSDNLQSPTPISDPALQWPGSSSIFSVNAVPPYPPSTFVNTTSSVPSNFQTPAFSNEMSSSMLTDDQAQYGLNAGLEIMSFLPQDPTVGDLSDFAMGDSSSGNVGQNDQWMQMLREFGIA